MIGVIIATYNCEKSILKTLDSLLNQNFTEYEVVFVDGMSNDDTLEIINSYKNKFERNGIKVTIISENDKGIYDAMNKGILKIKSDYLFFLNSNDVLLNSDVFINVNKNLGEDIDILYGNIFTNKKIRQNYNLNKQILFKGICHQSAFIKKDLFNQFGLYDISFKISADYDFFVKAYANKKRFKYIDLDIIRYDMTGYSSQSENMRRGYNEYRSIIKKNLSGFNKFKGYLRYLYLISKYKLFLERK
ncbi:glycosyltransferase family 2 protein [Clostridium tertium]|jgi:glycosyltransferase involved in cell wall biosynthesis|uniref:glycosyltransferase family 2 protein n=1 Tax=Clostridium tertium TaxID=1559 RepID=UPI00241DCEE5|nr:glycosyltransferase family 2 protein [Clostridium tertium]